MAMIIRFVAMIAYDLYLVQYDCVDFLNFTWKKRRSGRALIARRQTIWRRVLRHGALRAVGGKSRGVVCSALFERVFTWFCGDAGGSVLSLPELNWCYAIRRRVCGNAGVYLGMS